MLEIPILKEIENSENIILCGAGGGFDIFGAVPLYFYLKSLNKKISLLSYSFTDFESIEGKKINENCISVDYTTRAPRKYFYFPENFWRSAKSAGRCWFNCADPGNRRKIVWR